MSADASALRASIGRWADRVSTTAGQATADAIDAEQWVVGHPTDPFDPHQQLAMATFDERTDPVLAVQGTFPRRAYYAPGDHKGCQCHVDPLPIRLRDVRASGVSRRTARLEATITRSTPGVSRRGNTVAVSIAPTRGVPAWWPKALRREWPRALRSAAGRTRFG